MSFVSKVHGALAARRLRWAVGFLLLSAAAYGQLANPTGIGSVFGRTGAVVAAVGDYTIAQISGVSASVATALGVNVGTAGALVVNGGALGTPSSGSLANAAGYQVSALADTAWTAYTPSVVCGQATGTAVCTATGFYKQVGKVMNVAVSVAITGTFTAGVMTSVSLPTTSQASVVSTLMGRETTTGLLWMGAVGSAVALVSPANYLNSTTILTGYAVNVSGAYATQ